MHRRLTRTPWALAVRGAAALAFGLLTLSRPTMTVSTFVALFAALALCDGAATAAVAFRFRRRGADASAFADPLFLLGAGGAGIGAAALLSSDLTIRTLLTLVGAWAAVSGLGSLYAVSRGGERVPGWRLLAAAGVAGLALAAGVALAVAAAGCASAGRSAPSASRRACSCSRSPPGCTWPCESSRAGAPPTRRTPPRTRSRHPSSGGR
jgi:uncharacterized membrane protein HdeD (DUF308 family)